MTPSTPYPHIFLRADPGVNIIPGDYNGDGITDFIRQEKGDWDDNYTRTFAVYFAKGNGDFREVFPDGQMYQHELKADNGAIIIPGDYNGDGKTDFIRQEHGEWAKDGSNTFSVYLSKGDGTFYKRMQSGDAFESYMRYGFGVRIIPGDFNGDGMTDFIRQDYHRFPNSKSIPLFSVYIASGNGYFKQPVKPLNSYYQQKEMGSLNGANLIVGDYNGDGKADFIEQVKGNRATGDAKKHFKVHLSLGNGDFTVRFVGNLENQKRFNSYGGARIIPGDFNGDGKTDFIRQEEGNWGNAFQNNLEFHISKGDGTFTRKYYDNWIYQEQLSGKSAHIIPGDFNGDGKLDFLSQSKFRRHKIFASDVRLYLNPGKKADLLTSIEEGSEFRHKMVYKPMSDKTVYTGTRHNGEKSRHYIGPLYMLHEHRQTLKTSGDTITVRYKYKNARMGKGGRGFLGFGRVETEDLTRAIKTIQEFYTEPPLNGRMSRERVYRLPGMQPMRDTRITWNYKTITTKKFLLTRDEVNSTLFDNGGSYQKSKVYKYDTYGNLGLTINYNDKNNPEDDLYICTVHKNDDNALIFGRVKEIITANSCSYDGRRKRLLL